MIQRLRFVLFPIKVKEIPDNIPYSIYPTGTTIYFPDKAYNSHVLFDGRDGKARQQSSHLMECCHISKN